VATRSKAWVAAARFFGLRVQIPPGSWISVFCECFCCEVEFSAMGRSLVQISPIECGVSGCDFQASMTRGPWTTGGNVQPWGNFFIAL
jgi:hypothetical protein